MAPTITVSCPSCRRQMRASTDHVGRKARCPWCKTPFEIRLGAGADALGTLVLPKGSSDRSDRIRATRSTDVSPWFSALIGIVSAGLLYMLLFGVLRNTYIGVLFEHGGVVSAVNTVLTCWGLAILGLKYIAVKRQLSYAELELDLIPLDIGLEITEANVDQFLGHLRSLDEDQRNSVLGRRIQGALEHLKSRDSVPEVQQYLATQAEIDASSVDSGYTMLRTMIWANPILGFIGTVVGISLAVSGLSTSFGTGGGTENLVSGLGDVTSGLSTAFDTTLIGLVYAMILMFPTEWLRKTEYGMLDRIEVFANESLLRRMVDEGVASSGELPDEVRDAMKFVFSEHQRWLTQWQAQVATLGQTIGGDFEKTVTRIEVRMRETSTARNQELDGLTASIERLFGDMRRSVELWSHSQQDALSVAQSLMTALQHAQPADFEQARRLQDARGRTTARGESVEVPSTDGLLADLQREITRLVDRLEAVAARFDGGLPPVIPQDASGQRNADDRPLQATIELEPATGSTSSQPAKGLIGRLFRRHG